MAESSSSRARQDADADAEPEQVPPQRYWVLLVSTPVLLAVGDEHSRAMARGTDVELDLHNPPKPSHLVLHPRRIVAVDPSAGELAYQPYAYILGADPSGLLLFRVTVPAACDPDEEEREAMYLCSTKTAGRAGRRVLTLPAVPYADLNLEPRPRRSIGLVVNPKPGCRDHYLVAQLYPRESALLGDKLLCYSNAPGRWFIKALHTSAAVRAHNLCAETGVLAHDGRLYWLALGYGMFVCDPFAAASHLRFVPLPVVHEMPGVLSEVHRTYVAQRRRVAPSEGRLRFVEVLGLSYDEAPDVAPPPVNPSVCMFTLVDPEAEAPCWDFEYEAPFAEVWAHESYAAAGLPRGEVPHVAFVDPNNHGVVYFLLGSNSKLFGLDVRARRVVSCVDCSVHDDREMMLRNSRPILDAWELSSQPPPIDWP